MQRIYPVTPVAKPRMTRRDIFAKRPCVLQYRAFKDECWACRVRFDENDHIRFVLPMPKSWSKTKREGLDGKRHRQCPDLDNLIKALWDAVYDDDRAIASVHAEKVWGARGRIIVTPQIPWGGGQSLG